MSTTHEDLSRIVSRALRHVPWAYGLELDDEGWVHVEVLLAAIRKQEVAWSGVDSSALAAMIETSSKRRHELAGDRIRALYGHSVEHRIKRTPAEPPDRLFHGTSRATWPSIAVEGLLPMGRQYVHLSSDIETAEVIGRRKSRTSVVLVLDAPAASAAGTMFYEGNGQVWLADTVPAAHITVLR